MRHFTLILATAALLLPLPSWWPSAATKRLITAMAPYPCTQRLR